MRTRIITAIVAIIILIPVLWFHETLVFPCAMALLCAVAVFEMCSCINGAGKNRLIYLLSSALCAGAVVLLSDEVFGISTALTYSLFALSLIAFGVSALLLKSDRTPRPLLTLCALIYITSAFVFICCTRNKLDGDMWLMLLICPWASDIFAYFIGVRFGKHKLAPVLSPKKTVEGAVAGVTASALAMLVYVLVTSSADTAGEYIGWILLGAVIGAVSQAGDIYASAYKRKYAIKDYGKVFPGHGGVMDRFDSVLGAAVASPLLIIFEALI